MIPRMIVRGGWRLGRRARSTALALPSVLMLAAPVLAEPPNTVPGSAARTDLTELSLEELMNVEVTLVSRRPEPLTETAAAVAIITGDDVRRSGATSVPEALRMAPGLHVARLSTSSWAVASRGFSSVTSAKLLVLADGRSVYTPLFSGVFWDTQDVLLEDLDRIEVVRGPGGSLWGANAMNGVINIVSKSARDTQGLYVEGGGGTEERGFGAARYGGRLGENLHYRVYAKVFDRDGYLDAGPSTDDWRMGRIGFRADWSVSAQDEVTLQGDLYRGTVGQVRPALTLSGHEPPTGNLEVDLGGGNLLGRWVRTFDSESEVELQAYYDRTHRDDPTFRDDLDTFDLDLQYRFALGAHDIVWGAAYRLMSDDTRSPIIDMRPPRSNDQLVSGFFQDQWTILENVRLTGGMKLEHNDFSGFEVQPTGRFAWDPCEGQTVWGAFSRAVRVPTRLERDIFGEASAPGADPKVELVGNSDLRAEELIAFELGYRVQPAATLFLDLAGFYNRYDDLFTIEIDEPSTTDDGRTLIRVRNRNSMDGTTHGAEIAATWQAREHWRLVASYSYIALDLEPDAGSVDVNGNERVEGATPHNQVQLRSFLGLPAGFELDVMFRWNDSIASTAETAPGVGSPSYFNVDARLAWVRDALEVAVVGQNLVEDEHREFPRGVDIDRGVYGKVAWRFR